MHGQGRQEFSQYRILHLRGRQDQTHRCVFRRHLSEWRLRQARRKLIGSCLMSLTLHFHPLASYCHKVLIALYENGTPFTPNMVDLANETERAALLKLWPIGKFPVLRDDARSGARLSQSRLSSLNNLIGIIRAEPSSFRPMPTAHGKRG